MDIEGADAKTHEPRNGSSGEYCHRSQCSGRHWTGATDRPASPLDAESIPGYVSTPKDGGNTTRRDPDSRYKMESEVEIHNDGNTNYTCGSNDMPRHGGDGGNRSMDDGNDSESERAVM